MLSKITRALWSAPVTLVTRCGGMTGVSTYAILTPKIGARGGLYA